MAVLAVIAVASSCQEGMKFHPTDGGQGGTRSSSADAGIDGGGGKGRMVGSGGMPTLGSGGFGGAATSEGGSSGNPGSGAAAGGGTASGGATGTAGLPGSGGAASGGIGIGGQAGIAGAGLGGTVSGGRVGTGGVGTGGAAGKTGSGGIVGSGGAGSGTGGTMAACQSGATQCTAGNLQTCGTNGQWGTAMSCGAHRSCTGPAGTAQCTCMTDPVCKSVGNTCSGTTAVATCAMDGNGCFYQASSMSCQGGSSCSGGKCGCATGQTSCNGVCVDLQSDPNNCGACGSNSCASNSMGCKAGQCVCTATTPNGKLCRRPGDERAVCWGGACVLPAYFSGCNSAADCVPGGCTGPGGYCLGTIDVAAKVSCSNSIGSYVVCSSAEGCSAGPSVGQVQCGDGTATGTGQVTCDGPSDCPANNDCCSLPGQGTEVMHCFPQPQPGVIGSGCASWDTNPNGPQASVMCDPLNPTATCPIGKSCGPLAGTLVSFFCQ